LRDCVPRHVIHATKPARDSGDCAGRASPSIRRPGRSCISFFSFFSSRAPFQAQGIVVPDVVDRREEKPRLQAAARHSGSSRYDRLGRGHVRPGRLRGGAQRGRGPTKWPLRPSQACGCDRVITAHPTEAKRVHGLASIAASIAGWGISRPPAGELPGNAAALIETLPEPKVELLGSRASCA